MVCIEIGLLTGVKIKWYHLRRKNSTSWEWGWENATWSMDTTCGDQDPGLWSSDWLQLNSWTYLLSNKSNKNRKFKYVKAITIQKLFVDNNCLGYVQYSYSVSQKCAVLTNQYWPVFYMIFKVIKLALKCRLFRQIFVNLEICLINHQHLKSTLCHFKKMNASKRQTMQVLHTWVISLRIKRKGTFMQHNYMKEYVTRYHKMSIK